VIEVVPTDEEFDMILLALEGYTAKLTEGLAVAEVLKANSRLVARASKAPSPDETAFDTAFGSGSKDSLAGARTYLSDLTKEIDSVGLKRKAAEAKEKIVLLSAKVIRLRDQLRAARTDRAISDILSQ
jgi:hypothetical protein